MRATIKLYEDPATFSSDDIWESRADKARFRVYAVAGTLSLLAASTFVACKYTSLGKTMSESTFRWSS
ncbi:hypothetical protein E1B28_010365 [Marasmius oreades]|uniref:Uncharacterized protein n=1 Tax=Marasmius oreades TaxID=181124 RepID=A0A9P7USM0_9AGAR|nr:uncharacterized protein E1B28_010365 [Marasmius oreades]KAG7091321.1 hypothetical protein E1B28_010365 [Marasmius oreades]